MRASLLTLVLAVFGAVAAEAQTAPGLPLWMAGCWEAAEGGTRIVEHWRVGDGYLLGTGETWRAGRRVTGEAMRVSLEAAGPVFHATPEGQTTVHFPSTTSDPGAIVFENATHDFPQRIEYRLNPAGDSLLATVSALDAATPALDFRYRRIECR